MIYVAGNNLYQYNYETKACKVVKTYPGEITYASFEWQSRGPGGAKREDRLGRRDGGALCVGHPPPADDRVGGRPGEDRTKLAAFAAADPDRAGSGAVHHRTRDHGV